MKYFSEDFLLVDYVERVLDSIYKILEEYSLSRYKIRNVGIVVVIINLFKNWFKSISLILKIKVLMVLFSMVKDDDSKVTIFNFYCVKFILLFLLIFLLLFVNCDYVLCYDSLLIRGYNL